MKVKCHFVFDSVVDLDLPVRWMAVVKNMRASLSEYKHLSICRIELATLTFPVFGFLYSIQNRSEPSSFRESTIGDPYFDCAGF